METISGAVLCICGLSTVLLACSVLWPEAQFGKQLRLLCSLVFVCAVWSCVHGLPEHWESVKASAQISETSVQAEQTFSSSLELQAESNLNRLLLEELERVGISCSLLETEIHISESGSIQLGEVRLESADGQAAETVLKGLLGEAVPIVLQEG